MRRSWGRVLALTAATAVGMVHLASPASADITTDRPATASAVAVITQDPNADAAPAPDTNRSALEVAVDRAMANPTELAMPFAESDAVVAPAKTTASAQAVEAAKASVTVPITASLGGADGSIPDDGVTEKEPVEPNPEAAQLGAMGATVTVFPEVSKVKYSLADLGTARDEVLTLTDLPGSAALRTAYIDAKNNRVLIKAAAVTQELREALAAKYGADRVALFLEPGLTAPSTKATRQSDTSPFWGGAYFRAPSGCSTAFGWVHQGASYLLTAGHCTSLNGKAYNNGYTLGTVTADNWNNTTGSVKWNGQNYYSGDASTIKMAGGLASAARVYRGGSNSNASRPVSSRWTARSTGGDPYCVSGQVTGEMCGFKVVSSYVTVRYSDGAVLRQATEGRRTGTCTRGGDSGAPIYTIKSDGSVAAKGILSGGSTNTSGNCVDYFTDTSLAERALAGVIRVTS